MCIGLGILSFRLKKGDRKIGTAQVRHPGGGGSQKHPGISFCTILGSFFFFFFFSGVGENVGNKIDLGLIEGVSVEATYNEKKGNMSGTYNALFKKIRNEG